MKRCPADLERPTFDILVVGGGITGACLAFDACTRGLRVALIEKGDFGAATSSASSKLLHGGIRYLQQFQFAKVRESAMERIHFLNLAPHLVRWVPFVVPTHRGIAKSRALLGAGMIAYRALCSGGDRLIRDRSMREPPGRALGVDEIVGMVPGIATEGLTGGRLFHELHMQSSERMTISLIASAAARGAVVSNYVRASRFIMKDGAVCGVEATDVLDDADIEIRARIVLNAAGPWIRRLNQRLEGCSARGIITGFSKGAHIVTRPLTKDCAVALPTRRRSEAMISRGGRHVFVIPWRGHSLIGTSYGPYTGDLDDVGPEPSDRAQLIEEINHALGAGTLSDADVLYSFAGLYPLLATEIDAESYQGTGGYQVVDHGKTDGIGGLYSVFGAKFTTARLLAERALDAVCSRLEGAGPCRTRELELDRPPVDAAGEVSPAYAAEHEMACRLDDFVFRRTGLGTIGDPGLQALQEAADGMGAVLGWSDRRKQQELDQTRRRFAL